MPIYDSAAIRNLSVIASGTAATTFSTNERVVDMHSKLFKHHQSVTPFLSDLSRLAETRAKNSTIRWSELESIPDRVVLVNALERGRPRRFSQTGRVS